VDDFTATVPVAETPAAASANTSTAQALPVVGGFELQTIVARSADSVVYRGWDHELALPVAVKEYLPQRLARRGSDGQVVAGAAHAAFEQGQRAFVDESRALARCDHPGLLRVLHLLHAHGTAYRVMPWYAGSTLLAVRRSMSGPPNNAALLTLLDELLDSLRCSTARWACMAASRPSRSCCSTTTARC